MSTITTAIVLRETQHVLSAYTHTSGQTTPSVDLDRELLRNALSLRLVPQYLTQPAESAMETTVELDENSTSVPVEAITSLPLVGDIYDAMVSGTSVAELQITEIHTVDIQNQKATVGFDFVVPPGSSLAAGTTLERNATVIANRSPADTSFVFASRHFETRQVDPAEHPILSRPTSMSIVDEKLEKTPIPSKIVSEIEFQVENSGISVALNPRSATGGSNPKAATRISFETPVVAVMKTNAGSDSVVSQAVIPSKSDAGIPASTTIPFALIPSGKNSFLFMLKGFLPIWDQLHVGEKRTWKLKSE